MNAGIRALKITYEYKLKNAEYVLSLDEADTDVDHEYILRQRAGILLLKEFLKDIEIATYGFQCS